MKGISITWQPSSLQRRRQRACLLLGARNQHAASGKWLLARHSLRLLRRRGCRAINVFEYLVRAALQQRVADEFAQRDRIASALLLAQHFRAIGPTRRLQ